MCTCTSSKVWLGLLSLVCNHCMCTLITIVAGIIFFAHLGLFGILYSVRLIFAPPWGRVVFSSGFSDNNGAVSLVSHEKIFANAVWGFTVSWHTHDQSMIDGCVAGIWWLMLYNSLGSNSCKDCLALWTRLHPSFRTVEIYFRAWCTIFLRSLMFLDSLSLPDVLRQRILIRPAREKAQDTHEQIYIRAMECNNSEPSFCSCVGGSLPPNPPCCRPLPSYM